MLMAQAKKEEDFSPHVGNRGMWRQGQKVKKGRAGKKDDDNFAHSSILLSLSSSSISSFFSFRASSQQSAILCLFAMSIFLREKNSFSAFSGDKSEIFPSFAS